MPPKPPQTTKLPTKTSTTPKIQSTSTIQTTPNPQTPPKSSLSQTKQLHIDLNEPWTEDIGTYHNVNEVGKVKDEEVPIMKEEKKKQKEYEVFVGGLDRDAVEEDLEKVFRRVGEVVEVRLVKSRFSQRNKGFAFVRFATIEEAKRAASELNYIQIRGKVCEVTRNNDNETLHVGNICTTWTKDMLVEKLRPFELENLEEVLLIEDPNDKRKNRGYAFLNFGTHMDALTACQRLQKANAYFGTAVRADIAFAKSSIEPDEEIMAQVKSVFLDGLPPSWDEHQVHEHFKSFGTIDNIELARNMPSARRKDFGFLSFSTREAALSCIDVVNKGGIAEGARKVLLKASLRKPLQKRTPSTVGSWRGYNNNSYEDRSLRSRQIDRSYSNRPSRTAELFHRDSQREFHGYGRDSSRGGFKTEQSLVEQYGSQYRRGSFQHGPSTATVRSRSRDPYSEKSSHSRHYLRSYKDIPASYSRVNSHRQYDDEIYDPQYEYYEDISPDAYDYPAPSRLKRPYTALDDDQLVSRSLTKRARSEEYELEMDPYPVHEISSYKEYSRNTRDDYYDYDTTVYTNRYLSGSGTSESYHY